MQFFWFDSTDSTNTQALAYWHQHQPQCPVLIAAGQQTQGRGTQGRKWASPAGCGLYISLLLPAPYDAWLMDAPLTQYTGSLICDWLAGQGWQAPGLGIKPVNDIMWGNKKLGGILVERRVTPRAQQRCTIVGVGLNVHTPSPLTDDYPQRASALDALPIQPVHIAPLPQLAKSLGYTLDQGLRQAVTLARYHHWVQQWQQADIADGACSR